MLGHGPEYARAGTQNLYMVAGRNLQTENIMHMKYYAFVAML